MSSVHTVCNQQEQTGHILANCCWRNQSTSTTVHRLALWMLSITVTDIDSDMQLMNILIGIASLSKFLQMGHGYRR